MKSGSFPNRVECYKKNGSSLSLINRGFSLLEIIIVVGVITVVSVIAFPSFQRFQFKITRIDAVSSLMLQTTNIERCGAANGGDFTNCALSRATSEEGSYNLNLAITNNGSSYTITASRIAPDDEETCGNFTINNLGQRGMSANMNSVTGTVRDCWTE